MIASFPMYDRPETRPAWNRYWELVSHDYAAWRKTTRRDLPEIDATLTWAAEGADHWLREDLALSQTCSLPYRTRLHGKVTLLGAFDFGLPGCAPGYYNSVLVMRADDPRHDPGNWSDLTFAYNAADSQSGWAAAYEHLSRIEAIPARGIVTGSHHASATAVAEGRADLASLDAQTHRLLSRYAPFMAGLVEVGRTAPTPGLPLITARGWDANELWASLISAHEALPEADRTLLDLHGLTAIHRDCYTDLPIPPDPADIFPT